MFAVTLDCVAQTMTSAGLRATFSTLDEKVSDTKVTPTLALYVPERESATALLPGGKFRVVWSGFVRADLRDDVSFQAEVNGTLKLEIAGTNVLEVANTRGPSAFSEPVHLKKGLNLLRATFTSPIAGDAFVRVNVKSSDGFAQPMDPKRLSYGESSELNRSSAVREGLSVFLEHRCARCHQTALPNGAPELNMDAPSFDGIGSRLRQGWMAKWIADPRSIRPDAHMPKFRVASQPENAQAIAAFLATIGKNDGKEPAKLRSEDFSKARAIFETQHCDACHFTEGVGVPSLNIWSLKRVAEKFYPDALADYLAHPDAHFKWTGMPRYSLSRGDCEILAGWLISRSQPFSLEPLSSTSEMIQRGKEMVQSQGCLNCHGAGLSNKFSTVPLAQADAAHGGCLTGRQSLDFSLTKIERSALDLWLTTDRSSVSRNGTTEFAERHYARLHCAECHQKLENVPPFDNLGAKLQPEWAGKFIAGEITQKPRPWLRSQMPAFPLYASGIAQGLAEPSGFSPKSPTNVAPVAALADIGAQLVMAPPRGLACAQCHANGATQPTAGDAPGINFSMITARLQPAYFQRWVRKPSAIDPHTKMPSFFTDDGKSPLTQYFNGRADTQIGAIWEYLETRRE
jgi:mono/diheme cytochrome c family protein